MPSTAERNAAFDGVKAKVLELVKMFVPSFFEERAEEEVNDPKNTSKILAIVDAALNAAEKVRKK